MMPPVQNFSPAVAALPSVSGQRSLRMVDPITHPDWDRVISRFSDATPFHTSAWMKTLADAYGFQPCSIASFAGDTLEGVLLLMESRSWLRGRRGVSLPFTDECAPLADAASTVESLFETALRLGESRRWKHLELRGAIDAVPDAREAVSFLGHVLSLDADAATLFTNFESSVQRAVRKAGRSGVTVQFATDLEAVQAYYRLHCRTRTRHGAPPQPFRFFHSLCTHMLQQGRGFIALALWHGKPIAGAVFFTFADKAVYKFAASDVEHQDLRGANLVIWKSIQKLVAEGARELDFGKTSHANEGLRRFKAGWGARERAVRYARYSFAARSFVSTPDIAAGPQRHVFSVLPLFLSRWIGRSVYPHLS